MSPDKETPQPFWVPCSQCSVHPHSKEACPRTWMELPVFEFVSLVLSLGTTEESGPIFLTPVLKICVHIDKITSVFSRPNSHSSEGDASVP